MTSKKDKVYLLDNLGLANGVRIHYCQVRQKHWLLFPEGAIALNPTAVTIISSCNGNRSFEAIAEILKSQFCQVNISQVQDFLQQMIRRGLLIYQS